MFKSIINTRVMIEIWWRCLRNYGFMTCLVHLTLENYHHQLIQILGKCWGKSWENSGKI